MWNPFKRKPPMKGCHWENFCKCSHDSKEYIEKEDSCSKCPFYLFIDSGYGWCRALPEPIVVAWCKDICSFYPSKAREVL
ncbi:hypothetical protein LCGC14_1306950 [marine sediment metagenome]|uniref:Uncharacterized protein n=1 Tax=marine sediment metagenome TaxID=412755 RepID=A0A0F9KP03_9ZZZZ